MKNHDKVLDAMRVDGKSKAKLSKRDPASTAAIDKKKDAVAALGEIIPKLEDLQYRLYAESKTAVLVVFQAMDTGGKDGVIRKVFGPLNAQGVAVSSFKRPSDIELAHDFLWRIHFMAPTKGAIRIFNRSHYEDVLVRRVHKMDPDKVIEKRYRQINDFERYLTENDTVVLKFFLHISKDEQKRRLEERLADPDKNWKFEMGDLEERKLWDNYQDAYEIAIDKCSTEYAPWYVIPADNKWYRDWAVAEILRRRLKTLDPKYPKAAEGLDKVKVV